MDDKKWNTNGNEGGRRRDRVENGKLRGRMRRTETRRRRRSKKEDGKDRINRMNRNEIDRRPKLN